MIFISWTGFSERMAYSICPGWPPIHPWPWAEFSVAKCSPPTSALRRLQSLRWVDVEGSAIVAHMARDVDWRRGYPRKDGFNFFGRVESMISWGTPAQPSTPVLHPMTVSIYTASSGPYSRIFSFILSIYLWVTGKKHLPLANINLPVLRKSCST